MTGSAVFFLLFSAMAVVAAVAMLTRRNALDGAVCLVVCFLSFSGLYAMLDAPFVAIMQVLVYAGAIMMLIIFVVMTVDTRDNKAGVAKPVLVGGIFAALIMALSLVLFFAAFHAAPGAREAGRRFEPGTVERIGRLLFTRHVLNFEMISLLLLAALVGALVLGKKQRPA